MTQKNVRAKKVTFDSSKYKLPSMEDMEPYVKYAFTFNPCDQYQHFASYTDRFTKCMSSCREIFTQYIPAVRVVLYPEISKMGRFHFHGTIEICDVLKFYLEGVHDLSVLGTFEIDTIDPKSYDVWDKYCNKQRLIMFTNNKMYDKKKFSYPLMVHRPSFYDNLNKEDGERKGKAPPRKTRSLRRSCEVDTEPSGSESSSNSTTPPPSPLPEHLVFQI